MTTQPSKPDKNRVIALVRIIFSGMDVVYRYSSLVDAFNACEAIANAMFQRAQGIPTVPLIKGQVPLERIGRDKDGNITTDARNFVTSVIRIDHISFVGVVCPCCGEQIFDKIRPFHPPTKHDTPPGADDDDEHDPGFYDGDAWKEGAQN